MLISDQLPNKTTSISPLASTRLHSHENTRNERLLLNLICHQTASISSNGIIRRTSSLDNLEGKRRIAFSLAVMSSFRSRACGRGIHFWTSGRSLGS